MKSKTFSVVAAVFFLSGQGNADSLRNELETLDQMSDWTSYVSRRSRIVGQGKEILPELKSITANEQEDWRVRFMAGVCAERILRERDIDELDGWDWSSDPAFSRIRATAAGTPAGNGERLLWDRLERTGLWFHYLEFHDGRDDPEWGPAPHYRFLSAFLLERSTGAVRRCAARISDRFVRKELESDSRTLPVVHYPFLVACVKDGTFPEGAVTFRDWAARYGSLPQRITQADVQKALDSLAESSPSDTRTRRADAESGLKSPSDPETVAPPETNSIRGKNRSQPRNATSGKSPAEENESTFRVCRHGGYVFALLFLLALAAVCGLPAVIRRARRRRSRAPRRSAGTRP